MNYFEEVSLDNLDNEELIEEQEYQDYLRKPNEIDTKEDKYIERFLNNTIFVKALKMLPDLEKKVFFLAIIKNFPLNRICEKLKLTRAEVNNLKEISYKHFMQNVYKLKKSANKVGENNE